MLTNPKDALPHLNCAENQIKRVYATSPYQPLLDPIQPDYIIRLKKWLLQFEKEEQKCSLYLASKIIYFTHSQIEHLLLNVFRKIFRIILEEIIIEKNLDPFSYKTAERYIMKELDKTLFVGLTDSSRINDFTHVNWDYINRRISTGIELETLLYPSKKKYEYKKKSKLISKKKIKICEKFENNILLEDKYLRNKKRLVILEDFSGSGSDIINNFEIINKSSLPFNTIIFAPYITTYKSCNNLEKWINGNLSNQKKYIYKYVYGVLLPKEMMCFDNKKSYLKNEWKGSTDICKSIKQICEKTYKEYYSSDGLRSRFGFGNIKIAFVTYYNCPDNSLPIIWCDKGNWNPLFKRASRII